MTDIQKSDIIESILKEVNTTGSARVGYHSELILKTGTVPYSEISKVESTIVSTRKYKSRKHPGISNDYEIYKNPDYKNEIWHEIKVQAIAGCVAIIVGIIVWLIQRQYTNQEVSQLQKQLDLVTHRVDSLSKKQ